MFNDFYHPGGDKDSRQQRGFRSYAGLSGSECMLITVKNMCRATKSLAWLSVPWRRACPKKGFREEKKKIITKKKERLMNGVESP